MACGSCSLPLPAGEASFPVPLRRLLSPRGPGLFSGSVPLTDVFLPTAGPQADLAHAALRFRV